MLRNFAHITALDEGYTVMTEDGRTYAALAPDDLGALISDLARQQLLHGPTTPGPVPGPPWYGVPEAQARVAGGVVGGVEESRREELSLIPPGPDDNPMTTEDLAQHNLEILVGAYLQEKIDRDTLMERVGQLCPGVRQEEVSERINAMTAIFFPVEETPKLEKVTPVATAPKKRVRKPKAVA